MLAPGATPRQPAVRVAGREKPVAAAMHCGVYAVMQSVRFLLSTLCICTCVFVFAFLYLCINICNHDDSLWCLRSDAIPVVPASRLLAPGIPLQIPSWCRAGQFLTGPPPAHTRIPGILDFIPRPPFIICLLAWHVLCGLRLPKPNIILHLRKSIADQPRLYSRSIHFPLVKVCAMRNCACQEIPSL